MTKFRWTERRRAELARLRDDEFTFQEIARMMGCSREEAITEHRRLRTAKPEACEIARVPRPPAPAPTPARRPLIDLSKAPSAMEQAAASWRKGQS